MYYIVLQFEIDFNLFFKLLESPSFLDLFKQ